MPTAVFPELLGAAIRRNFTTQAACADAADIDKGTVSNHVNGNAEVRVTFDHLVKYLSVFPAVDYKALFAAWLRDYLPLSVQEVVMHTETPDPRLTDEVCHWHASLTEYEKDGLTWLSEEMIRDTNTRECINTVIHRFGYRPVPPPPVS